MTFEEKVDAVSMAIIAMLTAQGVAGHAANRLATRTINELFAKGEELKKLNRLDRRC